MEDYRRVNLITEVLFSLSTSSIGTIYINDILDVRANQICQIMGS